MEVRGGEDEPLETERTIVQKGFPFGMKWGLKVIRGGTLGGNYYVNKAGPKKGRTKNEEKKWKQLQQQG